MTPDEFLAAEKDDPNLWWRLECGEHQNLFEAAVEERDAALRRAEAAEEREHESVLVGQRTAQLLQQEEHENERLERERDEAQSQARAARLSSQEYYDIMLTRNAENDALRAEVAELKARLEQYATAAHVYSEFPDVRVAWANGEVCESCSHALCTEVRRLRAARAAGDAMADSLLAIDETGMTTWSIEELVRNWREVRG